MVQIDLAHARIPHEQIGVPITETSFDLQPHHRSRRSHSSVRGTARLSLSFLGQSEQNSSSQGGSAAESEEAEYGYASASSQESQQGSSSPLPEEADEMLREDAQRRNYESRWQGSSEENVEDDIAAVSHTPFFSNLYFLFFCRFF
ncbi:unnamed protein product [Gongylonema pulchrum]|uniref:Uncharacterized protein n=1 Tax=Gongylonema pulchrum TaxID=637853 RepID=A0A183DAQ8_9BILA|nr:unnamed protein product [Gongylonema pulchrum]